MVAAVCVVYSCHVAAVCEVDLLTPLHHDEAVITITAITASGAQSRRPCHVTQALERALRQWHLEAPLGGSLLMAPDGQGGSLLMAGS